VSDRGGGARGGAAAKGPAVSSELERIARLAKVFGGGGDASIVRAIGDDAAVLDPSARGGAARGQVVWTIDAQVEGVHFRADLASWREVGWRSFMAAASDLAAMGASPWCALSALVLPRSFDDGAFDALTAGQAEAARAVGAPIVGGNLSRGGEASITTTLLGTSARPLERTAARGDGIWVSGALGLAAAGLAALERKLDPSDPDVARAVLAWRAPRARIDAGLALAAGEGVHGAIDVSDGLARDLGHVARASGLRAVLEEASLSAHVEPQLSAIARTLGVPALDFALYGGEDYALVAASTRPIEGFVRIGRFEDGEGDGASERAAARSTLVVLEDAQGTARSLDARGFDHFR
jgi:thiamine-monophosphate kinase